MTLSAPLSSKNLGRLGFLAMALLYTALTFGVATAPVEAKSKGPYYVAEMAAPAKDNRFVAAGIAWKCTGTTCRAGKGTSRPIRICRGLVRKMGSVENFSARGETLTEEKLAKCNGN